MPRFLLTLLFAMTASLPAWPQTAGSSETSVPPPRDSARVFWSGHSLTDQPIPDYLDAIARSLGASIDWNRQYVVGSSIEVRTRGRNADGSGWAGYRQGYNRRSENLDVIEELRTARTIEGGPYDTLIITEVHTLLWALLEADTVRLLRHYHDRFVDGNPRGRTYFYESWLGVNDKANPGPWIAYEREASRLWRCIAQRINTSLQEEGRQDRLETLPAGRALADLVERAVSPLGAPGISAPTARETVDRIVKDNVHLTDLGSYYVALVAFGHVYGRSPEGAWAPDGVTPEQAGTLQRVAWEVVSAQHTQRPVEDLASCRSWLRERFADTYWRYIYEGYRRSDENFAIAALKQVRHTAQRVLKVREWRRRLAEDAPAHPLRFDRASDRDWWHPAP